MALHAKAKRAWTSVGFDPRRARNRGGRGLLTTEEWARSPGGVFPMHSLPGGGTRMIAEIAFKA